MIHWLSENRRLLLRLFGTLLAILLLTLLLRGQGWGELATLFSQISPAQVVLAALLVFISRLFIIARWYVLLRSGGVEISLYDAAALTFTGLFANSFLPTTVGGDVVRLAGAMQMGFDRAVCLASIAADRLVGMLGMIFVLPLGLAPALHGAAPTATGSVALGPVLGRLPDFFKRTLQTFSIWLKRPGALLAALVCSFGHMACIFGALYVLILALGDKVPFWLIGGLWSINYFVTLVPVSINGYGVQELSLTFLFSTLGGLSPALSAALAILIRALYLLASLPGAFFLPNILAAMAPEGRKGRNQP